MPNIKTTPTGAYPSIPDVGDTLESHGEAIQAITDSLETGERRDGNYLESFITFQELVTLGIIDARGEFVLTLGDVELGVLNAITDVTITGTPANNEVLAYDTATSEWINQTAAEAGLVSASHTHVEDDITDLQTYLLNITGSPIGDLFNVTIEVSPQDKEFLVYDLVSDEWINQTAAELGLQFPGGTDNDMLHFSGGQWTATDGALTWDQTTLKIFDSTKADSAAFSHGGVNFTTIFDGTTDWLITGLTGVLKVGGVQIADLNTNWDAGDIVSGILAVARIPNLDAAKITTGTFANARIAVGNVTQHVASIDHDALLNFLTGEHYLQSAIAITASQTTSGTFANALIAVGNVTQHEAAIDHDALLNFVSGEHYLQSAISITGGQVTAGTFAGNMKFDGEIVIKEMVPQPVGESGYGVLWVKNTTPNELWFTNDASQDFALVSDLVSDASPQLGGNLASNGFDILMADNDKVIFGDGGDMQMFHVGGTATSKITNLNANAVLEFNFTGGQIRFDGLNDRLDIHDGWKLRIKDLFDTDWADFFHDGADFNTDFENTQNWVIKGLASSGIVQFWNSAETEYLGIDHGGAQPRIFALDSSGNWNDLVLSAETIAFFTGSTSGSIRQFEIMDVAASGAPSTVGILGYAFRIYDGISRIDYAEFKHDGTDFITDFTNTADWNITGLGGGKIKLTGLGATGDQIINIDADSDNLVETANAILHLSQDGNLVHATFETQDSGNLIALTSGTTFAGRVNVMSWPYDGQAVTFAGVVDFSHSETDFNATFLSLTNTHASGQTALDFWINGTLRGKLRADFVGNLNYISNGGDHVWFTGGDSGVGTIQMKLDDVGLLALTGDLKLNSTGAQIFAGFGTAADPAISVRETSMGIYSDVSGQLKFSIGGAEQLRLADTVTELFSASLRLRPNIGSPSFLMSVGSADGTLLMAPNSQKIVSWEGSGGEQFRLREMNLFIDEQAAAYAGTIGRGQIWVKNTTPNELWFTTDAANDIQLTDGTGLPAPGPHNHAAADITSGTLVVLRGGTGVTTKTGTGSVVLSASPTLTGSGVYNLWIGPGTLTRDKLRVWSTSSYTIGMTNGFTFGALLNEYAMTFQMNSAAGRGWWWGDDVHTGAQGAMSLNTLGKLSVAHSIRLGYGETDTTEPGATYRLDVSGQSKLSGNVYMGGDIIGFHQAVSGNYGSVQVAGFEGSSGGWAGYSIMGNYVLMSSGTASVGIYNDVDNEWMIICNRNAAVDLRYNGIQKLTTTNIGVNIQGALTASALGVAAWTTAGQTVCKMTISTAAATGGANGDIHYRY